jgi:hypothetical protein
MAQAVFTDEYKRKYADLAQGILAAGSIADLQLTMFAVGEFGGVGDGTAVDPDPSLVDVVSTGSGPGSPGNGYLRFDKAVTSWTVTANAVEVVCDLDANEAGLDGEGVATQPDPTLHEIGVFDADGTMAAYGTFDSRVKTAGVPMKLTLTITFSASET